MIDITKERQRAHECFARRLVRGIPIDPDVKQLTHDVVGLCDHIAALTKQFDDARATNQSLSTLAADYDRQVQDLKNEVFELKTRLDAERVGLDVARRKRAETREALTKAFADLSNALWETMIPDPVNRGHVATTLHRMHVAVHRS